jgi:hypothetical protein
MTTGEYASYAWRLEGITRSIPGWMGLGAGRLRFVTPEEAVFDVPLAEVAGVVFPWYYFGGGVKLRAAGQACRFSFVGPNGAEYAVARAGAAFGDPASLLLVASKAADIGDGRGVGKEWRRLLGGAAQS